LLNELELKKKKGTKNNFFKICKRLWVRSVRAHNWSRQAVIWRVTNNFPYSFGQASRITDTLFPPPVVTLRKLFVGKKGGRAAL
jgi:hypothetical protein